MENVVVPFPAHEATQDQKDHAGNQSIPLCTVDEFAADTGLSAQSIRRYIRAGELPAMRMGNRWLIRIDKLLEKEAANEQ